MNPADLTWQTGLPAAAWQGLRLEWQWVYHGQVPVTGVWSGEITVPSGWFWVQAGRGVIQAGGREVEIPAGHSFFSAPGVRRQWFAPGTRLLSVGFRFEHPGGLPVFQTGLNLCLPPRASAPLRRATEALHRLVHGRRREVGYRLAVLPRRPALLDWSRQEAGFREWFAIYLECLQKHGVLPQPALPQDHRLSAMIERLEAWPLEQPLSLRRLAAGARLGERRAHDLLRGHLGMTAQAWLERRRIEAARARLLDGQGGALKEVAYALGFRHPPHFTAWFKRHTGLTPTAFRAAGGAAA